MPKAIRAYCDGLWHAAFRKTTRDGFYQRHANGETWDEIEASIEQEKDRHVMVGTVTGEQDAAEEE